MVSQSNNLCLFSPKMSSLLSNNSYDIIGILFSDFTNKFAQSLNEKCEQTTLSYATTFETKPSIYIHKIVHKPICGCARDEAQKVFSPVLCYRFYVFFYLLYIRFQLAFLVHSRVYKLFEHVLKGNIKRGFLAI